MNKTGGLVLCFPREGGPIVSKDYLILFLQCLSLDHFVKVLERTSFFRFIDLLSPENNTQKVMDEDFKTSGSITGTRYY